MKLISSSNAMAQKRKQKGVATPVMATLLAINILTAASCGRANAISGKTAEPAKAPSAGQQLASSEVIPSGDIPDNQVFVAYAPATGSYELQVPEGWSRTEENGGVFFTDKFNGIRIDILHSTDALSIDSVRKNQVPGLEKSIEGFSETGIKESTLKGGKGVIVSYNSISKPDAVTAKQIKLENQSCFFARNDVLAIVTVWAPLGADNVDQWDLILNSFRWR
ncbi:MAG TPA: hypothetical protein PKO22_01895 [Treponemataceae bacterium]|nr:hypothetical protein [Treponemataceae bacterium]